MRHVFLMTGLLLTLSAPAAGQFQATDEDGAAVAAACGGEVSYERLAAMPRAKSAARMACFQRETAKRVNLRAPAKVDALTTLETVTAEDAILIYHFKIDVVAADVRPGGMEQLEATVRTKVCANSDQKMTISAGGAYRYVWTDRTGSPLGEVTVATC